MKIEDLKKKKIHLIGVSGAEGSSLALFLIRLGCRNLTGHDFKTKNDFLKSFFAYHENLSAANQRSYFKEIKNGLKKINFKDRYLKGLAEAEIIFAPASHFRYPQNRPLKKYQAGKKIKFWSWYNLLLEFFPGTIIGVTGTAGKGTATNLIYRILKQAGKKVFLVGESWQFADWQKIFQSGQKGMVVAEISNRTLTFAPASKKSPSLAIITNIFPNHLDDHQNSFKRYLRTKLELVRYQKKGEWAIINRDDAVLKKLKWPGYTVFYSLKNKNDLKLIDNDYLKNYPHLKSDCLAAVQAAKILKISPSAIKKAIKNFKPRTARLQTVRRLKGVTFINDAAATRPKATIFAVNSLPKNKVILILEGSRKIPLKKEFMELLATVKKQRVKKILLSGQIRNFLKPLFQKTRLNYQITPDLAGSIKQAWQDAQKDDVILLSPACESFGEFRDYRARSEKFVNLVKKLK